MQERTFKAKIAAILLLAVFVRLLGILSRPIWYDEAFSILFSEKGFSAMLYGTLAPTGAGSADIHPLGYYTLLWLWMKAFGESLLAARLLSIVAGLASVCLVYLIAWEALSDARTALYGMLFAALAPFQVHYAQEIRMYAFLAMWLLLATYAYQRGSKTKDWRWWGLFSVSAALAQYTHNLAAFYLVALAIWPVLKKDWSTVRSLTLAGIGALILYLPWALQLPAQFAKIQSAYWVARPDMSDVFTLLLVYVTNTPVPAEWIAGVLVLTLSFVMIGLLQTLRQIGQTRTYDGLWLFYLSFAPALFLFVFSQWRPVYIERALLPSGAIFCIWLAWVVTRTNLSAVLRYSLLGFLGIACALGIYQHIRYQGFPYGPFEELDGSLRRHLEPQDVIVHSNKLSLLPAMLFDRGLPQAFIGDPPGGPTDTLAPATQEVLRIRAEKNIQSATKNAGRVWYIIYERSIEEYRAGGYETHPDVEYLGSQYSLESQEQWDGLQVFLYTKEP